MTVSEQRLWNWLRNRTFGGFKFRRQAPIGRYVLDFYCPALKLAVEVDGQHHETPWMGEYDDERTCYLQSQGIEVVRIANKLLATDPLSAARILEHAIATRCGKP